MDFNQYLSPFTWRYGSDAMREIWSETNKRKLWRRIWVALATAEADFGLVTQEQLDELAAHVDDIDIPAALEIEEQIHHDLMAEINIYAQQCPLAGGIIHLGATSMDVEDNADALRLRHSLSVIDSKLAELLHVFADQIELYAELPVMAFTHLQPAEPTTLGYRLAFHAQDLLGCTIQLKQVLSRVKGKGFKGAVGTAASYIDLFGADQYPQFEQKISQLLDLPFFSIASQTYPRIQDYEVLSALAAVGSVLYKFAFDLRILQSPPIGELAEPFGKHQIGSSAMPFKRNPIRSEKIDSLGRMLAQMPVVAWNNAAHSLLERTLDDSANRRTLLPEAFLSLDEMLSVAIGLVKGLQVNQETIAHNFNQYSPFAATERILMAAVKAGADRQEMHTILRESALAAWNDVKIGKPNPLNQLLLANEQVLRYLPVDTVQSLLSVNTYLGIAPQGSKEICIEIRKTIPAKKG
jgi:adenylosuccinate lyase